MNLEFLASSKLIAHLGWTLLHSLWQIALISLILFPALRILRPFSANTRYLASIFALFFATALPVITFVQLSQNANSLFSQSANLSANSNEQIRQEPPSSENISRDDK